MTFRRILVGWDGSACADAALRLATRFAAIVGAEVEALAVFDRPGGSFADENNQPASREWRSVPAKFGVLFGDGNVPFHAVVQSTSPGHTLAAFAQDHGFDLIAVGKPSAAETRDHDGTVLTLASITAIPLLVASPDRKDGSTG
jgi:nucleotide-binding universal stress UspA family protein